MPTASLYDALGVSKGATTEEIRRAYKDQAKQKHPDRGGDPEEFKAIQEAHEVLCDEGRRKMYDMTGSTEEGGGGMGPMAGMAAGGIPFEFMGGMGPFGMPGVSFDFGSMFNGMFGGGGGGGQASASRKRPGKGPNKHHDIGLGLADFYGGREIKLKFNQARRCKGCGGSGADQTESCGPCGGRGVRTQTRMLGPGMMAQSTGPCDVCSGEGKRVLRTCKSCHGKKLQEAEKELTIVIKPGMQEGETLVFEGECSDTHDYERPGDVVLTLKRADVDGTAWEWRFGGDLWTQTHISFAESLLGFQVELPGHPSGKQFIVGWHGAVLLNGKVLKAKGWGMPKKEGGYGDAYIQIHVDPPTDEAWTAEQRTKLEEVLGVPASLEKSREHEVSLESF